MRFSGISAFVAGWLFATSAPASEFAIVGAGDGLEIVSALAAVHMAENPGVSIVVPPSILSEGGIAAVASGEEIIGRISRPLQDSEKQLGLVETPIFKLPTAFYVHPSAGVEGLSSDQVRRIYSGEIRNWSEVGGADRLIKVVRREETETSLAILRATIPGWRDLVLTDHSKTAFTTQQSQQIVIDTLGAIGFGPYAAPIDKALVYLEIDGEHPVDEDYPSSVTVSYIYNEDTVTDRVLDIIEFARTEKAQILIRANGGVPVKPGA